MLERICKLTLMIGLILGLVAIILIFTGGSYSHETTSDSGFRMSIKIGGGKGSQSVILGSVSIALLIVAGIFLVVSK
jgi:hypothetical protein